MGCFIGIVVHSVQKESLKSSFCLLYMVPHSLQLWELIDLAPMNSTLMDAIRILVACKEVFCCNMVLQGGKSLECCTD